MHVLMLSWEFPPLVIGGIARHVHDLAQSLSRHDNEVTVVTAGVPETPAVEEGTRLHIHRVQPSNPRTLDIVGRVMQLNLNLLERVLSLTSQGVSFDLVHAHDWVTAYAGKALKQALSIPLIATLHATEYGRNYGLHNDLQRYISDVEWWLCYEAWRVICCSRYMSDELRQVFQLPGDKIGLIPNGVFPEEFAAGSVPAGFREQYAANDEKILFYVGRLVREKGLDILIEAMPTVLNRYAKTKLIVAGRGGFEAHIKERARELGVYDRCYFTGYIDDRTRNLLYRLADAAVFPSLYEPFGIVALEAMAAGAPVVVSDTGGMSEIVVHGGNGLKAQTGNPVSLAENILWLLSRPDQATRLRLQALEDVRSRYDWNRIASLTAQVYREVTTVDGEPTHASRQAVFPAKKGTRVEADRTDLDRYTEVVT